MIKNKYLQQITNTIHQSIKTHDARFFIYGSSLRKDRFGDVDIGVEGNVDEAELRKLKQTFKDSTLPYFVEVVDFNKVSPGFRKNVLNNKVLWIKH